ncbi:MAG: DUF1573 domain-containing protein [Planctomycetota bacterium]
MSDRGRSLRCLPRSVVLVALLAASCGSEPGPALVLRPGARPAPVAHTKADPVERPNYHWFGDVPQGDVVEHTFVWDNTSSVPVAIQQALASCGCLELDVKTRDAAGQVVDVYHEGGSSDALVPPGGTLDVTFHVRTALVRVPNVPRLVTADVRTDDPRNPVLRIEATVTPTSAFQMVPDVLNFGTIAHGATEMRRATIAAIGGPELELELTGDVDGAPSDWVTVLLEREVDPGVPRTWDLDVRVPPGSETKFAADLSLASVDAQGRPGRPWIVPVRGTRGPDFFAAPDTIYFRGGKLEAGGVRIGSRVDASTVSIDRVEVDGPLEGLLDVEVQPGAPLGGTYRSWVLVPKLGEGAPEECSGRVLVCFDDDSIAPIAIPYFRFP